MIETSESVDWWWIDYLENEMDQALEKDLELLLECSQEDRDSFEHFRLLTEWLRDSDPAKEFPIEEKLHPMRKRVMSMISGLEIENPQEDYLTAPKVPTKSLSV